MMPMCLAENSTWVCIGSTDQLIATLSILYSCRYNYTYSNSMTGYFPLCNYCASILGVRIFLRADA